MSAELDCFRHAVELGCLDFVITDRIYFRGTEECTCLELPYPIREGYDPAKAQRVNRYAAGICAEWWAARARNAGMDNTKRYDSEMFQLLARAFGKKYGGA